jgi:hypothetical protein
MSFFSIIPLLACLTIGGFGLLYGGLIMFGSLRAPGWRRWPMFLGGAMITAGVAGFFGQAISAIGGFNWLPETVEWPAGWVDGVIKTETGLRVVPTEAAGRVQVYDGDWKFIRGWHIGPGASGAFALRPLKEDRFEVFTARGNHHYVFDTGGNLISEGTYPGAEYSKVKDAGEPAVVPTAWWLWIFAHPLIAWLVAVAGMAFVGLAAWRAKNEAVTTAG